MKLKDQVAIITGGAKGIGKAIATLFVKEGAKVVIVARTAQDVKNTQRELQNFGGDVIGVVADISNWDEIMKVTKKTLAVFKTIEILVNCAGTQNPIGSFLSTDREEWLKNVCINLIGTTMCCRAVLPVMINNKRGKIINFSGGGATAPRPNFSAYACSKTAVVRFTEILAIEVKDRGIDVNAIAPGVVNTRMIGEIVNAGERAGEKELTKALEFSRKGKSSPELVADLALFLASKDSNGFSGKLVSAVWDDWKGFNKGNISKIINSSLYTLRRVDGRNFVERKI